jgi:D-sedoheptulose 7-phosphate isomerase
MNNIRKQIEGSIKVKQSILDDENILTEIEKAASICIEAIRNNNKILFAGNGGSAADAQHLAAELVNRFGFDRPGLPALALTTDTSVITSISNDYGYDKLFSRQIQAIGCKGDVLIVLSTSGRSANITFGIAEAKKCGLSVIGLTGESDEKMKPFCDVCISVPSSETPRIQEAHILIGHIICSDIENTLFGKNH